MNEATKFDKWKIKRLEKKGKFQKAAEESKLKGLHANAVKYYELAEDYEAATKTYFLYFDKYKNFAKPIELLKKAGKYPQAIELAKKEVDNYESAAAFGHENKFLKKSTPQLVADLYIEAGKPKLAARYLAQKKQADKAIEICKTNNLDRELDQISEDEGIGIDTIASKDTYTVNEIGKMFSLYIQHKGRPVYEKTIPETIRNTIKNAEAREDGRLTREMLDEYRFQDGR